MTALHERPDLVPLSLACEALGVNRGTVYAWRRRRYTVSGPARRCRKGAPQPRALSALERERLLERMNQPEFWDQTPYQVYHTLLERGECQASLSTFYRVLRDANQTGDGLARARPDSD